MTVHISKEHPMKDHDYFRNFRRYAIPAIFILALCACVPTTPQWDQRFGESVSQIRNQQILDPQAGGDAPVNGVDGAAARESIGRYRNSFRELPPASSPLTIVTGR
jgi:hypothetical protein